MQLFAEQSAHRHLEDRASVSYSMGPSDFARISVVRW